MGQSLRERGIERVRESCSEDASVYYLIDHQYGICKERILETEIRKLFPQTMPLISRIYKSDEYGCMAAKES
jgi:hypothetical protein